MLLLNVAWLATATWYLARHFRNAAAEPRVQVITNYVPVFKTSAPRAAAPAVTVVTNVVATNDFPYVSQWQVPNLFAIHDFAFVRETFCRTKCHEIKEFIVEEMVLVLCTFFQPSAPSSITDTILHLRLEEHGSNEHDVSIYEAYNQLLLELKKQRKGVIFNFDALFENLQASHRPRES